uniref:Uncharacterized protein n=1 Tax=Lotus japonicus TaxID=34305 RepID=I3T3E7_LOTJA|nr:unknown [Lotus japonicus]
MFPFEAHHALCFLLRNNSAIPTINIYFVSQDNKWEVFRVRWTSLDKKFFSPMVEVVKRFHDIYIINKGHSSPHPDRKPHQETETVLDQQYPKSAM